jgi:hypothetical protein
MLPTNPDTIPIGLAGIDGVWWRPAAGPFHMPVAQHAVLRRAIDAYFALFDAVAEAYRHDSCLRELLNGGVPPGLPRDALAAPVLFVRPDFQLLPDETDGFRLMATELEVCPSAQGVAHALQVAHGLPADLVDGFVRLLNGRALRIVMTQAWSEFVWDQLAFCKGLADAGARATVMFDAPFARVCDEIARGARWLPPMFGIPERPAQWNTDVRGRISANGLSALIDERDPAPGDVVFRFGYSDCFSAEWWRRFNAWQVRGVTFLNPPSFVLDSKSLLAAARLPAVQARLGPTQRDVLAQSLLETRLLEAAILPQLRAEREAWVLKFAGYDRDQRAWGGRSLQVGATHSSATWHAALDRYCELPFPCVAQRAAPSAVLSIDWRDSRGRHSLQGRSRLRVFGIRIGSEPQALGAHVTVAEGGMGVSESVHAVQAPVVFDPADD